MSEKLYRKVRKVKHPWQGVSVNALGNLNECEYEYVPVVVEDMRLLKEHGYVVKDKENYINELDGLLTTIKRLRVDIHSRLDTLELVINWIKRETI